jgi:hypothetical protein
MTFAPGVNNVPVLDDKEVSCIEFYVFNLEITPPCQQEEREDKKM